MFDTKSISRIALFRALQLGDLLCVIPAIRTLRRGFPHATITLIGLPWQKDLVSRFPSYFDSFIEFSGWPGLPETIWSAERCIEFLQSMQECKFDLVLQLQGNGMLTNSMCLLWNGRLTAGLRKSSEPVADPGYFPISEDSDHEILRFFKITDALGLKRKGTHLEFPLTKEELQQYQVAAATLGLSQRKYACIHPGARDPRRRWNPKNFARVADALANAGLAIVLTGSPAEIEILEDVARHANTHVINSVRILGTVSLGTLACIIKHSNLLVSNDTGVSHVASALEVPSVIIFSPYSDQARWTPLNTELHIPVSANQAQSVDHVIACALSQLTRQAIPPSL